MVDRVAKYLTFQICRHSNSSEEDTEKIQYALEAIIGEASKLAALLILFGLLGRSHYFILSIVILLSIRTFSGGLHGRNGIDCFIFSAFIFIISCVIAPALSDWNSYTYILLALISLIVISTCSPVASVYRPILSNRRTVQLKMLSMAFTAIWLYVLFFHVKDPAYFKSGISIIFIQAAQLSVSKLKKSSQI